MRATAWALFIITVVLHAIALWQIWMLGLVLRSKAWRLLGLGFLLSFAGRAIGFILLYRHPFIAYFANATSVVLAFISIILGFHRLRKAFEGVLGKKIGVRMAIEEMRRRLKPLIEKVKFKR